MMTWGPWITNDGFPCSLTMMDYNVEATYCKHRHFLDFATGSLTTRWTIMSRQLIVSTDTFSILPLPAIEVAVTADKKVLVSFFQTASTRRVTASTRLRIFLPSALG
eukprot:SAG22_NODE_146_length_17566_cov_17.597847_6_plen_107_part_00